MSDATEFEIWKSIPIDPWEGFYEVSNRGRVRLAPRIVPSRNINGYPTVSLRKQGYKYTVGVHRLVAAAFIRPPEQDEVVNHINADRSDNAIENLEWVSQGENCRHTAKLGRTVKGASHPWAKINPEIALQMRADGAGLRAIAARFGCSHTAVSAFLKKSRQASSAPT